MTVIKSYNSWFIRLWIKIENVEEKVENQLYFIEHSMSHIVMKSGMSTHTLLAVVEDEPRAHWLS